MHDVFDFKLNRVEVDSSTPANALKSKTYDLLNSDKFWKSQKGNPFPVVAESIQEELEKYKQYDEEIKNLKDTIVRKALLHLN